MSDASGSAATTPPVDGSCDECGFDYDSLTDAEAVEALRGFARRYRAPLSRGLPGESLDDLLRAHPLPGVWSALEYACHVRDVFAVQRERVALAQRQDLPDFVPMRRDERVAEERYNEQDPAAIADALATNAEDFAAALEALTADQWSRRGVYHYPEPAERDVAWIARHTVHEGRHHLLDIGRVLRAARGR
ncbi:MAG: DinB family protein [Acidimicrobiales bacterium]